MNRGLAVAIAVDQLANALLGGWPDETLSARAYRQQGKKRRWAVARAAIDGLFFWQPNHCQQAYESEKVRSHLPASERVA